MKINILKPISLKTVKSFCNKIRKNRFSKTGKKQISQKSVEIIEDACIKNNPKNLDSNLGVRMGNQYQVNAHPYQMTLPPKPVSSKRLVWNAQIHQSLISIEDFLGFLNAKINCENLQKSSQKNK